MNSEITVEILNEYGFLVDTAENGAQAVEKIKNSQPGNYDLVLMDVQMPVMNGYEAVRAIRNSKNPLGKKIPVIAMTANAFAEDIQKCLDAGMDAHIAKPVDFDKLKEVLQDL